MSECGIASARQSTSTSWRTMLSTPPRRRPGQSSSFSNTTGIATVSRVLSETRRKSTCSGWSVTGWNCTSRANTRCAVPSRSISVSVVKNPVRDNSRRSPLVSKEMVMGVSLPP